MAKRAFDLGAELRKAGGPTVDTREQIEYIDLDRIDPDPENFYSLDGLDELAGSIELVGLQQPLRVRDGERGHVIVVSGHRRRAACMMIRDGGSDMFKGGVPCIRERGETSKEMQELRLIFANSQTRVLSGAEISRQAERVEELLYKLQEQGVVFPGRMRDHVAEAVNTSKSRIGRLHAIRERLDKPLLKLFDKNTINETVAYALSQQPLETQRKICDQWRKTDRKYEYMTANYIHEYVNMCEKIAARKCKVNKGCACINRDGILDKAFDGSYSYAPCKLDNECCADCSEWLNCRDRCPLLEAKAKEARAKKREERKDELAAEKAQKAADIRTIEQVWARYAQALAAAGTTDAEFRRKLKRKEDSYNPFDMYMDKEKVEALLDYSASDTKQNDPLPFWYSFKADDYGKLCRFADALGVSLDYLFLRSDRPEMAAQILSDLRQAEDGPPRAQGESAQSAERGRPGPSAPTSEISPGWRTGEPPKDGWFAVWARYSVSPTRTWDPDYEVLYWTGAYWTGRPGGAKSLDYEVLGWYPLPEGG